MTSRPNSEHPSSSPHYPPPRPPQAQGSGAGGYHSNQGYSGHRSGVHNHSQAQQPQYDSSLPPQQGKTLMLILCCVGFISVAGIHRFLSGHIFLGILYIFTGGLCVIGTIVDLIAIASGTYRDVYGRPLIDD